MQILKFLVDLDFIELETFYVESVMYPMAVGHELEQISLQYINHEYT